MAKYSETFRLALEWLFGMEGEWSDNPADSGGKTMHGITETVARSHGYNVHEITQAIGARIYYTDYWLVAKCDQIEQFDPELAVEVFDIAVNGGPGRAGELLQEAINTLNRHEDALKVDGAIGPVTLRATYTLCKNYGRAIVNALNGEQYQFYKDLVNRRAKDKAFIRGWCRLRLTPFYYWRKERGK